MECISTQTSDMGVMSIIVHYILLDGSFMRYRSKVVTGEREPFNVGAQDESGLLEIADNCPP